MENERDYLKDANAAAFHWYQQADTKAQVLLGFSGVFLSIMVASLFSIEEKSALLARTGAIAGLCTVMLGHLVAISLSVAALWSRGIFLDRTRGINFFGQIANYDDVAGLREAVSSTSETQLVAQFATNLYVLSRNTRLKHQLVDVAAVVSSLSLLATVVVAIYIVTG